MTIDAFVLLTPVLLLGVIALFRFVGCATIAGIEPINYSAQPPPSSALSKPKVTIVLPPPPIVVGQAVTIKVLVAPDAGYAGTATPDVKQDSVLLTDTYANSAPVDLTQQHPPQVAPGVATFSNISFNSAGQHTIKAHYNGDTTNFDQNDAPDAPLQVDKANTTVTITSDLSTSTKVGTSYAVAFTVTVDAPGSGTPTGNNNVSVNDGTGAGSASCTGSSPAGQCSLTSTTPGVKTITATYPGDANFNGSSGSKPHTVWAPITHVQTQALFQGSGGNFIQLSSSPAKGSLLIVTVFWQYSAAPTTVTVSDGTNAYQPAVQSGWGANRIAQSFYAFNAATSGTPLQIKATPSVAASELRLVVSEYSNANTNPLDGTGKQTGAGTAIGPATFTTTLPDDLIYAVAAGTGASGTITPSVGFTNRTPGSQNNMLVEEKQAAGTSQSAGGTDSVAAGVSIILALAIKHP